MTYELIKYGYGRVKRYTAWCLTPKLNEPRRAVVRGMELVQTNQGPSAMGAHHFERPATAKAWLRQHGHEIVDLDWTPIEGTQARS